MMDRLLPDPRPQRLNETALFLAHNICSYLLDSTPAMASNEPQSRMQTQNRRPSLPICAVYERAR
jgi:hypothetical protein